MGTALFYLVSSGDLTEDDEDGDQLLGGLKYNVITIGRQKTGVDNTSTKPIGTTTITTTALTAQWRPPTPPCDDGALV